MTVATSDPRVASPPDSSAGRWLVEPFTLGSAEQLERVRAIFADIGYTEEAICERAKVASIYDLAGIRVGDTPLGAPLDALTGVVHLFFEGTALPWSTVDSLLGARLISTLQSAGLLVSSARNPEMCVASLAIYPLAGLYVASDRHGDILDLATAMPADLVYSAITPEARQFVRLMPRTPCDDYLELCSGTGIAALIAGRSFAARATAIDITERSTRFARFNAALNGLENVTALEGDLYAPVAGQTFDLITAHPPYVPSLDDAMVYRDGGDDGERITRGILAGLSDHLRPGGTFFCACMVTDRNGSRVEARIRSMLGASEGEFDVVVAQTGEYDIEHQLTESADAGTLSREALATMLARFRDLGIEEFVGTAMLIQRRADAEARPPVTRRRVATAATSAEHLAWYMRWSTLAVEAGPDWYLDARPRHVADTELLSRSVFRDGKWTATAATLKTDVPFAAESACPVWVAALLRWCDGMVTARTLLQRLRDLDVFASEIDDAGFAAFIRGLAEGGFIELDLCPLPGTSGQWPVVA